MTSFTIKTTVVLSQLRTLNNKTLLCMKIFVSCKRYNEVQLQLRVFRNFDICLESAKIK